MLWFFIWLAGFILFTLIIQADDFAAHLFAAILWPLTFAYAMVMVMQGRAILRWGGRVVYAGRNHSYRRTRRR